MFVGNTGTGKTAVVMNKLRGLDPEAVAAAVINMNSFSDAPSLQLQMEQSLEKKSGVRYGPPGGRRWGASGRFVLGGVRLSITQAGRSTYSEVLQLRNPVRPGSQRLSCERGRKPPTRLKRSPHAATAPLWPVVPLQGWCTSSTTSTCPTSTSTTPSPPLSWRASWSTTGAGEYGGARGGVNAGVSRRRGLSTASHTGRCLPVSWHSLPVSGLSLRC